MKPSSSCERVLSRFSFASALHSKLTNRTLFALISSHVVTRLTWSWLTSFYQSIDVAASSSILTCFATDSTWLIPPQHTTPQHSMKNLGLVFMIALLSFVRGTTRSTTAIHASNSPAPSPSPILVLPPPIIAPEDCVPTMRKSFKENPQIFFIRSGNPDDVVERRRTTIDEVNKYYHKGRLDSCRVVDSKTIRALVNVGKLKGHGK